MSIKIGDIEKTLPDGMFLHKDFIAQRFHSVVKLTETNVYIQRKNQVIEQSELIREEKNKMRSRMMDANVEKAKRTTGMSVPKYIQSSKHLIAEKKIAQKDLAGRDTDGGKKGRR